MRQVVLQMSVTLDGYVAGLPTSGDWGLPPEHEEVTAWKLASVRRAGAQAEWPFALRAGTGDPPRACDRDGVAESLLHMGWIHQVLLGDGATALPLFREAVGLAAPAGDPHVRSELHRHIGFHIAIDEKRPEAALPHFIGAAYMWVDVGQSTRPRSPRPAARSRRAGPRPPTAVPAT